MSLTTGHPSIRAHSLRLPSAAFITVARRSPNYVHQIDKHPFKYFVMGFGAVPDADRDVPLSVTAEHAAMLVELLTLAPSHDRHKDFLIAKGFLDGNHLSWSAITSAIEAHAVVRVDTRLLEAVEISTVNWNSAVVCLTACDQWLNHFNCEHCMVARNYLGDPFAAVCPSVLTSEAALRRKPGRPRSHVLGSCRQSEDAAEAAAKRRKATAQSPTRHPEEDLAAAESTRQFDMLRTLLRTLWSPATTDSIDIQSASGKTLRLWSAKSALPLFRQLLVGLEQANGLRPGCWHWHTVIQTLSLVPILRAYASHPNEAVATRARELQDRLRSYLVPRSTSA